MQADSQLPNCMETEASHIDADCAASKSRASQLFPETAEITETTWTSNLGVTLDGV
jgi:hypothetical protein